MGNNMEHKKNQEADVSAKRIFGNPTLCAQFLRNYAGLPMLADIQPEDIEDVTERYHLFQEVEFQTDTVKKVHLHRKGENPPETEDVYILSLVEHKSSVDYDVTMQLLKYMVCIWENEAADRAKKEEKTGAGTQRGAESGEHPPKERKTKRKDYRYPPIFPIVYYEGSGEWTAAGNLKERILMGDVFEEYIPDFTYKLVKTQDYSKEELLSREDAISLLMLLNKIQQAEDFEELSGLPSGKLNEILRRAPMDVTEIIVSAVRSLCRRLNLTERETAGMMKEMEAGNMGYLWENMEKMDIQLERRNTAEARKELEEAKREAQKQVEEAKREARLEAKREARQEKLLMARLLVKAYQEQGMDKEAIAKRFAEETGMGQDEIGDLLETAGQI